MVDIPPLLIFFTLIEGGKIYITILSLTNKNKW